MKVIKLGGSLLEQPNALDALFASLVEDSEKTIVVHGGGAMVQQWLSKAGLVSEKVDGLRVSPPEHMPYIVGALAGCANKHLMSRAIAAGLKPVGLTLYEAGISCQQQSAALGQVGVCATSGTGLIDSLLTHDCLPLISPIGFGSQGEWFNVNADDAAVAVAANYNAELLFLTDVEAVLDSNGRAIPQLDTKAIELLVQEKVIQGGMLVKVRGALDAAKRLRRCVRIGSWNLISQTHSGTQISE
ncbi:acetylglutamate kinase [Idiomarina sp. HP20-50]|uniref:acetylglutamate kinase n=1 Tax=Idiomarina sp. HP20-50 TaxID=3070813 RepID=UPI00294B03DD|nr:acetylglutamate kinase [Idiomarina sp. HP20-50]MDV6316170.1 acetylglutamate kinase [Idiomarina sp. HP20-50]